MYLFLVMGHMAIAIMLIVLVLLQHGKGADMGAGLGSGASGTVFGSRGTGGFLFKLTGGLALGFCLTSLLLSAVVAHQYEAQTTIPSRASSSASLPVVPMPADRESK